MNVKSALTAICFGLQTAEPPTFLNLKVPEPSVKSESVQSSSPSPSSSAPCCTAETLWSDFFTALFHCGNSALSELQASPSDPLLYSCWCTVLLQELWGINNPSLCVFCSPLTSLNRLQKNSVSPCLSSIHRGSFHLLSLRSMLSTLEVCNRTYFQSI